MSSNAGLVEVQERFGRSSGRGLGQVLDRFGRGSGEVRERFGRGSGEVQERFRRGSGEVGETFSLASVLTKSFGTERNFSAYKKLRY